MKIADKVYILGKEVEVELREAEKNKRNTGQEKKSKSEIKYLSSKTVKAGNEILENKQRKKKWKKKGSSKHHRLPSRKLIFIILFSSNVQ